MKHLWLHTTCINREKVSHSSSSVRAEYAPIYYVDNTARWNVFCQHWAGSSRIRQLNQATGRHLRTSSKAEIFRAAADSSAGGGGGEDERRTHLRCSWRARPSSGRCRRTLIGTFREWSCNERSTCRRRVLTMRWPPSAGSDTRLLRSQHGRRDIYIHLYFTTSGRQSARKKEKRKLK